MGCFAGDDVEALLGHAVAEKFSVRLEPVAQLGRCGEQLQRADRAGGDRWRDGVRKQVGPRALAQHVDDLALAAGVAAAGAAEGLAQRAGQDIDPAQHAVMFVRAATLLAHETDGMRVIHHDERIVLVGEIADCGQVGDGAVHGENAVGDDEAKPRGGGVAQLGLEVGHVVVPVAMPLGLGRGECRR